MKLIQFNHRRIKQAGRSLVELMIAITIGLFILIAVSTLFLSNSQTSRTSDDKSRLEDEGRLALNLIAFHLRMAGYGQLISANPNKDEVAADRRTNFQDPTNASVLAVTGCTGSMADTSAATVSCSGNTLPDSLIIKYVIDQFNANNTNAGVPTDCLGQGVVTSPAIVENRFFVQNNPSTGRSELYCIGNGGTPFGANLVNAAQPIAENIIDFKITYGSNSTGGQSIDGPFTAASPATVWNNVIAVNVCVVGQSANDNVATKPQQYRNCAGQLITATDRRLYSAFSTVVALRSRI